MRDESWRDRFLKDQIAHIQNVLTDSRSLSISVLECILAKSMRVHIKEGGVYKKAILALVLSVVLIAGCGGGPKDEVTAPPRGTVTDGAGTDTGNDGAERPTDGDVSSEDMAIRSMQTIYFDFDKYNLRDDAKRGLEANAKVLTDNPGLGIMIEGHCDERGTNEYNLALGERRAKAARDYLVRLGITESRMMIRSYGEERPADPGHTEAAWAKNRRAQFVRR